MQFFWADLSVGVDTAECLAGWTLPCSKDLNSMILLAFSVDLTAIVITPLRMSLPKHSNLTLCNRSMILVSYMSTVCVEEWTLFYSN